MAVEGRPTLRLGFSGFAEAPAAAEAAAFDPPAEAAVLAGGADALDEAGALETGAAVDGAALDAAATGEEAADPPQAWSSAPAESNPAAATAPWIKSRRFSRAILIVLIAQRMIGDAASGVKSPCPNRTVILGLSQ